MTHRFDLHLFHDSFDLGGEFSAPEPFGFFNGKGQIIHCQKIPIVFGQMFYLNHGGTSFGMENSSGTGTVYPVQYRNRG